MKVVRHGKPSKQYLQTLKNPSQEDYGRLVNVCLEAIVSGEKDVIIAFAYVLKFPEDFPKGIIIEKVDDRNVHRIKAKKLLVWLKDNGHTDITSDMLRGQIISFGIEAARLEELFEGDYE